jgi:ribosomal protein S18 acetylase RimI-like enzyme
MPLPSGPEPRFGLSPETLRFLECHSARAIAIPGRGWRDFGDSLMLFSGTERDPFFNRLIGIRWPQDPAAFDRRLAVARELFGALDRKPYLWVAPGWSTPTDIVERLAANGFVDQGGGFDMLLVDDPGVPLERSLPRGAVLEKHNCPSTAERYSLAADLATVIAESFHIPDARRNNLIVEIALTMEQPRFHAYVLRVDGEPVATGERYTFDGASYISSIGTRLAWRGRGFGRLITQTLARDSIADGIDLIYLGVYADNARAISLYERIGFRMLGNRTADMLMERSI